MKRFSRHKKPTIKSSTNQLNSFTPKPKTNIHLTRQKPIFTSRKKRLTSSPAFFAMTLIVVIFLIAVGLYLIRG